MRYKEFDFEKERLKYCLLSEICKISTTKDNRQYAHAWDYCTLTKGMIYLTAWAIVCCLVVGIAEPQIRQHSIVPTLLPFILTAYFWGLGSKNEKNMDVYFSTIEKKAFAFLLLWMMNIDEEIADEEVAVAMILSLKLGFSEAIVADARNMEPQAAFDIITNMNVAQKAVVSEALGLIIHADNKVDYRELQLFKTICDNTGLDALVTTSKK